MSPCPCLSFFIFNMYCNCYHGNTKNMNITYWPIVSLETFNFKANDFVRRTRATFYGTIDKDKQLFHCHLKSPHLFNIWYTIHIYEPVLKCLLYVNEGVYILESCIDSLMVYTWYKLLTKSKHFPIDLNAFHFCR